MTRSTVTFSDVTSNNSVAKGNLQDDIKAIIEQLALDAERSGEPAKAPYTKLGTAHPQDTEIDPRIQRLEDPGLINNIVGEFDPLALGVSHVSVRTDDNGEEHLIVLDGQQRRAAMLLLGYNEKVRYVFYYNLTFAAEARLFRLLNNRKGVPAPVLFRIAIAEGDQQAQAIAAILSDLNIPLGVPGGFSSVQMARRVARRPKGLLNFRWALEQVQAIYTSAKDESKSTKTIYDGRVIEAFALLRERDGNFINVKNLQHKLASKPQGVAGLLGHANTIATLNLGGSRVADVIDAIVARYNFNLQGRSGNKLEEWDRGGKKGKKKKSVLAVDEVEVAPQSRVTFEEDEA